MIIAISGKAGSGKDTIAAIIQEFTGELFVIKKFADKLKFITSYMTGVPLEECYSQEGKEKFLPEWDMTNREFQIALGTAGMRYGVHNDAWIISLFADYDPSSSKWIITDLRFRNELGRIKSKENLCLRVERPGIKLIDHISETDLDHCSDHFDEIIINDGTIEQLKEKIKTILIKYAIIANC